MKIGETTKQGNSVEELVIRIKEGFQATTENYSAKDSGDY